DMGGARPGSGVLPRSRGPCLSPRPECGRSKDPREPQTHRAGHLTAYTTRGLFDIHFPLRQRRILWLQLVGHLRSIANGVLVARVPDCQAVFRANPNLDAPIQRPPDMQIDERRCQPPVEGTSPPAQNRALAQNASRALLRFP